ncbi:MAG TPA: hypothetical protein DGH68_09155 [Bacteroidetes bacterium]|jgi:hypothetical protein|nr:hypothetical protein [Bacteroidota bacterium]
MNRFGLRFREGDVTKWSSRYNYTRNPIIEDQIVPRVAEAGYLTKPDFLTICRWKTPRSQNRCANNSPEFVESVSKIALSTSNEQLRIEIWTLLNGVNWPTASTLLYWLHEEEYPILDFRALWSLGYAKPPKYDFSFWSDYVDYCRKLARKCGVKVRTLDRALWQYSSEKQRS